MIRNKVEIESIHSLFKGLEITERIISGANKPQSNLIFSLFRPIVFDEYDAMLDPLLFELIDNTEIEADSVSQRNSINFKESKSERSNGSITNLIKKGSKDIGESQKKNSVVDTSKIASENYKTRSGFYKTGFSKIKSEPQPKIIVHKNEYERKGIQFKKVEILSKLNVPEEPSYKLETKVSEFSQRPSKLNSLENKYIYENYTEKRPTYKEIFTKSKDPEKLQIKKKENNHKSKSPISKKINNNSIKSFNSQKNKNSQTNININIQELNIINKKKNNKIFDHKTVEEINNVEKNDKKNKLKTININLNIENLNQSKKREFEKEKEYSDEEDDDIVDINQTRNFANTPAFDQRATSQFGRNEHFSGERFSFKNDLRNEENIGSIFEHIQPKYLKKENKKDSGDSIEKYFHDKNTNLIELLNSNMFEIDGSEKNKNLKLGQIIEDNDEF